MSPSTVWVASLLAVSASALSGCVVDTQPVDDPEAAVTTDLEGDVGEAEQAFGEAACATVGANVENSTDWTIASTSPYYSATGGGYGWPGCPNAFIVDYNNSSSHIINVWAGYYNQPSTSNACLLAHTRVHTYNWVNGQWVFKEEMKRHGVWRGGECWFDVDDGSTQATFGPGPTRVVAQAYSRLCLLGTCTTTYQGVKVNAYEAL